MARKLYARVIIEPDTSLNVKRVLAGPGATVIAPAPPGGSPEVATAPLQPAPANHVLTKSYYLIKSFPGRYNGRLWIESGAADRDTRRGDGVSGLFIGGSDWAGAWAIDQNSGRPLLSMEGGDNTREVAYRFGINLVMYILTGTYKDDLVHVPDLLARLGKDKTKDTTD